MGTQIATEIGYANNLLQGKIGSDKCQKIDIMALTPSCSLFYVAKSLHASSISV